MRKSATVLEEQLAEALWDKLRAAPDLAYAVGANAVMLGFLSPLERLIRVDFGTDDIRYYSLKLEERLK